MSKKTTPLQESVVPEDAYENDVDTADIPLAGQDDDAGVPEDGNAQDDVDVQQADGDDVPATAADDDADADPDVIQLSMAETMNLLEPDTRILFDSDQRNMSDEMIVELKNKIFDPWARRVHPFVHTYVCTPEQVAAVEAAAAEQDAAAAATAEGDDAAPKGKKKAKSNVIPEGKYMPEVFVLGTAYSDGLMYPGSMHVEQKMHGKCPPKGLLMYSGFNLATAMPGHEQQSNLFGRAMQRIGHRVLLGHFEIIGNLVTTPGICQADATPETVEQSDTASVPTNKLTLTQKSDLDTTATIYMERVNGQSSRMARVELLRISLAQYVELLKGELQRAENDKKSAMDNEEIRKSIVDKITTRINIAESYYKEGATPATDFVLPQDRTIDPNKVMLDIHQYRLVQPEALSALKTFDGCFHATAISTAATADKTATERMRFIARADNRLPMLLRCSYISRPRDGVEPLVTNPTPLMVKIFTPIVPHQVFFREVRNDEKNQMSPFIEEARRTWGTCCDKNDDNNTTTDDAGAEGGDDEKEEQPATKKAAVAAPTDDTPKKATPAKPAAKSTPAKTATATPSTPTKPAAAATTAKPATADKVKQVADRAEKTPAKVTFSASSKAKDNDDGDDAAGSGGADDDDGDNDANGDDDGVDEKPKAPPVTAKTTPAKSALKTPTATKSAPPEPAKKPVPAPVKTSTTPAKAEPTTPAKAPSTATPTKTVAPTKPAVTTAAKPATTTAAKPTTTAAATKPVVTAATAKAAAKPAPPTPAAAPAKKRTHDGATKDALAVELEPVAHTEDQQELIDTMLSKLADHAALPDAKRLGMFASFKKGEQFTKQQDAAMYHGLTLLHAVGWSAVPAAVAEAERRRAESTAGAESNGDDMLTDILNIDIA